MKKGYKTIGNMGCNMIVGNENKVDSTMQGPDGK